MRLTPSLFVCFLLLPALSGCGDSAQVAEDTKDTGKEAGDETEDAADEVADETEDAADEVADETEDAADEVADETEDAADEVADETEDAADEVAEEGEEAIDDTDAALDCANLCDAQDECDSGTDEDICYATCEDVAIDGEGNQQQQADLDACDDCVDAADDARCDADGQFVCAEECAAFMPAQ